MNGMLEHKKEIADTIFYTIMFQDTEGHNFKCDSEVFEGNDILSNSRQIPADEGDDDVEVVGLYNFQSRNEYTDTKWKRVKDLYFVAIVQNVQRDVRVLKITTTAEYCPNLLRALKHLTPVEYQIKSLYVYTHKEKADSFATTAKELLKFLKGDTHYVR